MQLSQFMNSEVSMKWYIYLCLGCFHTLLFSQGQLKKRKLANGKAATPPDATPPDATPSSDSGACRKTVEEEVEEESEHKEYRCIWYMKLPQHVDLYSVQYMAKRSAHLFVILSCTSYMYMYIHTCMYM